MAIPTAILYAGGALLAGGAIYYIVSRPASESTTETPSPTFMYGPSGGTAAGLSDASQGESDMAALLAAIMGSAQSGGAAGALNLSDVIKDQIDNDFVNTQAENLARLAASDTASLAGMNLTPDQVATVTHGSGGTTVSVVDNSFTKILNYVKSLYPTALNRPADEGGAIFWADAVATGKLTLADVGLSLKNSDEAKGLYKYNQTGINQPPNQLTPPVTNSQPNVQTQTQNQTLLPYTDPNNPPIIDYFNREPSTYIPPPNKIQPVF